MKNKREREKKEEWGKSANKTEHKRKCYEVPSILNESLDILTFLYLLFKCKQMREKFKAARLILKAPRTYGTSTIVGKV